MAIAIIPARGGSTRIPGKNIKLFHGKPIIAYSINTAKESGLFDRIIVSTDDTEIAEVAIHYGAEVHRRSDEMSRNEVGTFEVTKNVIEELEIETGYVCCIYATSPLMHAGDIINGFCVMNQKNASHVIACEYSSCNTNQPKDVGQFYWSKVSAILNQIPYWGEGTLSTGVPSGRAYDINTMDDWQIVEKMYEKLHCK